MCCGLSPLFGVRWAVFVAGLEGLLRGGGVLLGQSSGAAVMVVLPVSWDQAVILLREMGREAAAASGMFWPRCWTEVLGDFVESCR